jgi:ABC-type sugar transport system substrate-binding protein
MLSALAAVGALVVLVAGCAGDSGGSGEEQHTLGIVQFSGTDVTVNAVVTAAREAAEAEGWDVNTIDAQGATDKANAAIQNLVTAEVDAILVTVFSTDSLTTGLRAASDAGIPVVTHGGGAGDGVAATFDVDAGADIADRLIEDLDGSGSLLALTYQAGLPCLQRQSALEKALEGTDIEVTYQEIDVTQATNSGFTATTAWLANNASGPRAIWGCYDDPALGAISALKQQGVAAGDVFVYGFNNAPDAQAAIEDGFMTASAYFDSAKAGEEEFAAAVALANGEDVATANQVPSEIIDSATIAGWKSSHPDGF